MIQLKRVLHPTDFSETSGRALDYARAICDRFDAELHALHVIPDTTAIPLSPGGYIPPQMVELEKEYRAEAANRLESLLPDEWERTRTVHRVTRHGPPFLGIIEYAKEVEIDLIVLGTHGRSGLVHMLMGSVAEKVVRKSPCAVLTVPPNDHQFVMP